MNSLVSDCLFRLLGSDRAVRTPWFSDTNIPESNTVESSCESMSPAQDEERVGPVLDLGPYVSLHGEEF